MEHALTMTVRVLSLVLQLWIQIYRLICSTRLTAVQLQKMQFIRQKRRLVCVRKCHLTYELTTQLGEKSIT